MPDGYQKNHQLAELHPSHYFFTVKKPCFSEIILTYYNEMTMI